MGVQRPRRLPQNGIDRPHVMLANCEVTLAEGVTVPGSKPRLLVTVRTHNARVRKAFRGLCDTHGLVADAVQGHGEPDANGHYATTTFDCVGSVAALRELLWQPYAVTWSYVLSATVGVVATGNGAEKVRSSGRTRHKKAASGSSGEVPRGLSTEETEAYVYRTLEAIRVAAGK
jgi:hypothetical protein